MGKICIVTLYGNSNLGNKLQNYAVQQKCLEYGNKVKTLKSYTVKNPNVEPQLVVIIKNLLRRVKHLVFTDKSFVNESFRKFQKDKMLMDEFEIYSNEKNNRLSGKYDVFVVGSDQVWNPEFGLNNDLRFLDFTDKKKIAFSASIGVDNIPEDLKEEYARGLKKLDYISVREDRAKEIVEELTGRKDVIVLVDPTMLLTKEEWKSISKKPEKTIDKKYILTYFLGRVSQEVRDNIEKLAKDNDLEIIDVMESGVPKPWIGPAEFVYLEEHAELICTDSFHSCVFGILMETPFIVFERQDDIKPMNSRLDTLLSKFKLKERKHNGVLTNELLQCDYSHCESILNEERKKADEFLKNALNIE